MRTRKNDRAAPNEEIWQGALDVGSAKLRLALLLTQSADGKLTGKLKRFSHQCTGYWSGLRLHVW